MCGVCAEARWDSAPSAVMVERMNRAQNHRGPDGAVTVLFEHCALGNTRLAIVNPGPEGDQPLTAPDGSVTAVFNGEIYNFRELVRDHDLIPGGSDGAVIPQLYARQGLHSFSLLRGMFAVILIDHRRGTLVLARDPLGIKPLHWRQTPTGILAASEIKPLLAPGMRPTADAVGRFLHLGSLPADSTPFSEVHAVAPNSWIRFNGSGVVSRGPVVKDPIPESASTDVELAEALLESTALHLRSDVPTALLLSSGLDSSAIAWASKRLGQALHCLTVDLGGGRSEAHVARQTADYYGHTHRVVRRVLQGPDLDAFFASMQKPSIDGLNTFIVCRAVAQQGYKVALSGLGGDEATAGYRHFRVLPLLRWLKLADRCIPRPVRWASGATVLHHGPLASEKVRALVSNQENRDAWALSLLQRSVWSATNARRAAGLAHDYDIIQEVPVGLGSNNARDLSLAEYRLYVQSTLLPDADAFSMASSIELRVPLVDRSFLTTALAAGSTRGLGKPGMAAALGEPYLMRLARQPKQGFALPMDDWMRTGALRPLVETAEAPDAPLYDLVDKGMASAALSAWRAGRIRWSTPWALVVLDQWMRTLT